MTRLPFDLPMVVACLAGVAGLAVVPADLVAAAAQDVRMASVVGCLEEGEAPASWMLTHATDGAPADGTADSIITPLPGSNSELNAAIDQALGTLSYRLLGTTQLNMTGMKNHKVLAKGLLIQNGEERRLNVTSLQAVATSCAPSETAPARLD